jgi:chloramphenicol 3-O-phosphotransferase
MIYPIYDALKTGSQFPYSLLVSHYEEVEMYWDWWWEQADHGRLTRPKTISDDDPVLQPTIEKLSVDTESEEHFFYEFASHAIRNEMEVRGYNVPRQTYREKVALHLANQMPNLSDKVAVFLGGGYGAGKTTALNMLCKTNTIPFTMSQQVGVDYCKNLLPEFHRVRMVADGRASTICQLESRAISDMLFNRIVESGRSLTWDSSMSDYDSTMDKIRRVRAHGYNLMLVGVWTPTEIAVRRAMSRARKIRRFAHPDYLVKSARDFSKFFPKYADLFDRVRVFCNSVDRADDGEPLLIAQKDVIDSDLEVFDNDDMSEFLELGTEQQ